MNISPVTFRSTVATNNVSSFQDMINKPQTYPLQTTPNAATNIKGKGGKKSVKKKIAAALVGAAAITAGVSLLAVKTNAFQPGKYKVLNKIKKPLQTAGEFIADKAFEAKSFISSKLTNKPAENVSDFGGDAFETASETAQKIANEVGNLAEEI